MSKEASMYKQLYVSVDELYCTCDQRLDRWLFLSTKFQDTRFGLAQLGATDKERDAGE